MATGQQATIAQVNTQLTSLALQLRNLAGQIMDQHTFLNKQGHDGLVALGFEDADATDVLARIDYMATIAQIYEGNATQATTFDFEDALCSLWAGQ
jgi:hypothetical protein